MAEASKIFVTKKQVKNALDLRNKNREKIKKLQTFDLRYFIGTSYFDEKESQNYLMFPAICFK